MSIIFKRLCTANWGKKIQENQSLRRNFKLKEEEEEEEEEEADEEEEEE